jgi:hypothetical protein
MNVPAELPRSNPFSTRFIRAGAVPFLFDCDESADWLVAKLADQQWRGQIIGPHGSGKSTLLISLEQSLRAAGRRVWQVTLHDGQRTMSRGWSKDADSQQANLIVVDGYEQLAYWQRYLLRVTCLFRGWGLLVTAHSDVGFPTLHRTTSNLAVAKKVVEALLVEESARLTPEHIAAAYHEAGGDMREMLFRLFDVWDSRRPPSAD